MSVQYFISYHYSAPILLFISKFYVVEISTVCMTILFQYRMYGNIISVPYVWQYYFSTVCMTILFQYRRYDNIISVSYVWQYYFSIVCMSIISASYVGLNLTVYSLNNFISLSPVTASGRRGWGNQRTKI